MIAIIFSSISPSSYSMENETYDDYYYYDTFANIQRIFSIIEKAGAKCHKETNICSATKAGYCFVTDNSLDKIRLRHPFGQNDIDLTTMKSHNQTNAAKQQLLNIFETHLFTLSCCSKNAKIYKTKPGVNLSENQAEIKALKNKDSVNLKNLFETVPKNTINTLKNKKIFLVSTNQYALFFYEITSIGNKKCKQLQFPPKEKENKENIESLWEKRELYWKRFKEKYNERKTIKANLSNNNFFYDVCIITVEK